MARNLGHAVGNLLGETGRRNLLHLTVVLGIIVEELITRHDLRSRQHDRFLPGLIATLRDLRAVEEALHHHFRALHHRLADGGSQLVLVLHLGNAE